MSIERAGGSPSTGAFLSMQVSGFEEIDAALARLSAELNETILVASLMEAGAPMTMLARQYAWRSEKARATYRGKPRPPGHMFQTIKPRRVRGYVGAGVKVSVTYARAYFWGMYQEFGTRHTAPFPFLRPAFDEYAQDFEGGFAKAIRPRVEEAIRKAAAGA